jgi:hypothetical protein
MVSERAFRWSLQTGRSALSPKFSDSLANAAGLPLVIALERPVLDVADKRVRRPPRVVLVEATLAATFAIGLDIVAHPRVIADGDALGPRRLAAAVAYGGSSGV